MRESHGTSARLDLQYHKGNDMLRSSGFVSGPHAYIHVHGFDPSTM